MGYPLIDFFRVYRCIRRAYSFHGGADKFPDTSVQKFFPGITASYFTVCALAEETTELHEDVSKFRLFCSVVNNPIEEFLRDGKQCLTGDESSDVVNIAASILLETFPEKKFGEKVVSYINKINNSTETQSTLIHEYIRRDILRK